MFSFGIKDIIDILLVATLLFYLYRVMRESGSLRIFFGVLAFVVVWIFVSQVFEMKLLGSIFDKLVSVGVIGIIVLFQTDIRRFFLTLGSQRRLQAFLRLFSHNIKTSEENPAIMQIVRACSYMSKNNIGALIVFERDMSLDDIIDTGEKIDAAINGELIKNIFFKNSPLHDGAMIISSGRISAAACILPVSHSIDIPKQFGLRHRAALGISQQSDAFVIVVSEETGKMCTVRKGLFQEELSAEDLERILTTIL